MVASGQLLLEQGASLEVKDKAGRTPLLGAAQGGHTNVLELLQVLTWSTISFDLIVLQKEEQG